MKNPPMKAPLAPHKNPQPKTAPEKKPRIRNPEQTRTKLLQATIDLLAEKGPDGVSLKEAALVADVSRGVAYQHFADREHLLREAKAWMSDRLVESVVELKTASLEENVKHIAKLVLSNREAAGLLVADALSGKALDAEHPLYKLVLKDLAAFKTSGNARQDFDVEIMSFIMLGSIATLVMLSRAHGDVDTDVLAQRFTTDWTRILRDGLFVAR
jgi:AcrR family transcriptional regulator